MKRLLATLLTVATVAFVSATATMADDKIKVGWIGPLTGWGTAGGTSIMRGAALAIDMINEQGGVHGRMLELVPRDSAAKPEQAVNVARELIDSENVYVMIGKYDSSSAKALNPAIHEAGIPMMLSIAAATKNIEYDRDPNFMFRTSGADHYIAPYLLEFAIKEFGAKNIAIGYEDTGYGFGGRDDVTHAMKERGMEPVAKVKFSRPDTDMTAQAQVIKRSGADTVILYSIAKADAMMIRSLNKVGADVTVICAWAASTPAMPEFAGPLANGITVMQTYSFLDPNLDDLGKEVLARFMKKHDIADPSDIIASAFAAQAYDGMLLLAAAMKKADLSLKPEDLAADRMKIRDALENGLGPVKGLIKTYDPAFTKDRHDSVGLDDYIMTVWQDGKLIPYNGKYDWGKKH